MSNFFIKFNLNGNYFANMFVSEDMMFCEVVHNFSRYVPLKEENEAKFFFNSKEIKSDSAKNLKELGVTNMSIIEVKTKTPINIPFSQNSMGMNSFQPMGYMGMNNFMGGMNEEVINIKFNYSGSSIPIQAKKNEAFSDISQKFCMKAGIRNNEFPTYFLGSRKIDSNDNQTLSQLYIPNNSEISVFLSSEGKEEFMFILFRFQDKTIICQGTKKTKFSELCKKFCDKAGIQDGTPTFLVNSMRVELDETRTLDQLRMYNNIRIDVVLISNIIGV